MNQQINIWWFLSLRILRCKIKVLNKKKRKYKMRMLLKNQRKLDCNCWQWKKILIMMFIQAVKLKYWFLLRVKLVQEFNKMYKKMLFLWLFSFCWVFLFWMELLGSVVSVSISKLKAVWYILLKIIPVNTKQMQISSFPKQQQHSSTLYYTSE